MSPLLKDWPVKHLDDILSVHVTVLSAGNRVCDVRV